VPPVNPNRGFELMKIADVGTSLSTMRAHANGDDGRVSTKIASKCITTVDNVMTTP
jgi:hypothetical protein